MNTLELGQMIQGMIGEISDREVKITDGGSLPDGSFVLFVKIDGQAFTIEVSKGSL